MDAKKSALIFLVQKIYSPHFYKPKAKDDVEELTTYRCVVNNIATQIMERDLKLQCRNFQNLELVIISFF